MFYFIIFIRFTTYQALHVPGAFSHFQNLNDGIDFITVKFRPAFLPWEAAFIINGSRSEGDFPAPCRAICWSMSSLFCRYLQALDYPASCHPYGIIPFFYSNAANWRHVRFEWNFSVFTVVLLRNYLLEMVHLSSSAFLPWSSYWWSDPESFVYLQNSSGAGRLWLQEAGQGLLQPVSAWLLTAL